MDEEGTHIVPRGAHAAPAIILISAEEACGRLPVLPGAIQRRCCIAAAAGRGAVQLCRACCACSAHAAAAAAAGAPRRAAQAAVRALAEGAG